MNAANVLTLPDLAILLFGYFHDQNSFVLKNLDYIFDCHPGNILYDLTPNNYIVFSWSDFGRSFSIVNKTDFLHDNERVSKMYLSASSKMLQFIINNTEDKDFLKIVHKIEILSAASRKFNSSDYFSSMLKKLEN